MTPLVIFDLDGTISNATHRQWMVQGPQKDFRAFYAACDKDALQAPIAALARALRLAEYELWLWSGRSDEVRQKTELWLHEYRLYSLFSFIRMRREGDYTPDDKLKMSWYDALPDSDRERLMMTIDDRDRMVRAWRDRGVTCLQVADGNF